MSGDSVCLIRFDEDAVKKQSVSQSSLQSGEDLIIDYREQELIKNMKIYKPNHKNLQVGDINIGNKLIIERKTIVDFEASFIDGRYRDQRTRLLVYCQEIGAQPLYILEGDISSPKRLTQNAINKLLLRLIIFYKIPIFQTKNIYHTAQLIEDWYCQWLADPESFQVQQKEIKLSDTIHVSKKINAADPKQFLISCLCQVSGVSVKMAEMIISTFPSFELIMSASIDAIANIKLSSGRKLGPTVADRIFKLFHSSIECPTVG